MGAAREIFTNKINDWAQMYLNENIYVILDKTFYYNYGLETIAIATDCNEIPEQISDWFNETLNELGLMWEDLPWPLLAFLHEAGHSQTLNKYSNEELQRHYYEKLFISWDSRYTRKEKQMTYWRVEDELAANTWAVNFANTNTKAIEELTIIFMTYWNDLIEEVYKC